jgi:hypothetical protein
MYILCHLAAGLIIGMILYWFFRDPVLIIAAGIGGIASDLIDKPLGHIILKNSIDYGRIYAHGLVFLVIILICSIIVWYKYRSLSGIAFSLGILSHQLLDRMWDEPVSWFYPFRGPFIPESYSNYFGNAFFLEIFNPSEWLFASGVLIVLVLSFNIFSIRSNPKIYSKFLNISTILACVLGAAGLLLLYPGKETMGKILTGLGDAIDIHFAGFVMLMTAFITGLCIIKVNRKR